MLITAYYFSGLFLHSFSLAAVADRLGKSIARVDSRSSGVQSTPEMAPLYIYIKVCVYKVPGPGQPLTLAAFISGAIFQIFVLPASFSWFQATKTNGKKGIGIGIVIGTHASYTSRLLWKSLPPSPSPPLTSFHYQIVDIYAAGSIGHWQHLIMMKHAT